MKRITISHPKTPPIPGSMLYAPPDCQEIHLSDGVAHILGEIIHVRFDGSKYPPESLMRQLNMGMDPYKVRMECVGLKNEHFFDLVLTLRSMAQYARVIQGTIQCSELITKTREAVFYDDSTDDYGPYG